MGISSFSKALLFLCILSGFHQVLAQSSTFRVTLDAGHGGKDSGASYSGHVEKDIALSVVKKVGRILEDTPGIKVIYTRKTDVFVELVERANIANRADSHLFVSIHCNANKNTAADGTETYVMGMTKNASNLEAAKRENAVVTLEKDYKQKYEGFDPDSPETMMGIEIMAEEFQRNSISLAGRIQDNFVKDLNRKSRGGGVKQAPYMVLHKAYMPRVLIEMGFVSNSKEGAFLDSDKGQNELAKAIADAIISYRAEYFLVSPDQEEQKPSERIPDSEQPSSSVASASVADGVLFKVQIAASSQKLQLLPKNFKGLKGVSVSSEDGKLFRYTYGKSGNLETIRKRCEEAKEHGFPGAYIVAFRHGKSISMNEALK